MPRRGVEVGWNTVVGLGTALRLNLSAEEPHHISNAAQETAYLRLNFPAQQCNRLGYQEQDSRNVLVSLG
jgi:hypothetical protein